MELNFEPHYFVYVDTVSHIDAIQITNDNIVEIARWIYSKGNYKVKVVNFETIEYEECTHPSGIWKEAHIGDWLEDDGNELEIHTKEYYDKHRISVDEFNERMI